MTQELKTRLSKISTLHGWCTMEKAEDMASLILEHKPGLIVELGVFGGRSLIAMAMAAESYGATVYGIDPWTNKAALEGEAGGSEHAAWWSKIDFEEIYRSCMKAIATLLPSKTGVPLCTVLRIHDRQALKMFDDGSIDFLHLDSNHSEEVSFRSVNEWVPKIRTGGFLVMDDTDWFSQTKAVSELRWLGMGEHLIRPTYGIYRKQSAEEPCASEGAEVQGNQHGLPG